MSNHVPSSPSVCLHSVCVSPAHRRKNIGSRLLREYISRLESARKNGSASYERILLLTHQELRPFYEGVGFEWVGKSEVVHGSRPWFEMRKSLTGSPPPHTSSQTATLLPTRQGGSSGQELPSGVWEAMQRSSRNRPTFRLLSSFPGGILDVVNEDQENKLDLICPREGCGSVILNSKVAKRVKRAGVQVSVSLSLLSLP
jgi:guanine nucleotide exchange factor